MLAFGYARSMMRNTLASLRFGGPAEMAVIALLAWAALVSVPVWFAPMGLSWDALNHHIYLGWMAQHSRLDEDFLAAGYQTLTYPYLYWPVYRLAAAGAGPQLAGAVLASLHVITVPAVWLIARSCIPGTTAFDAAMRAMAVLLAFLSGVMLSQLDSSSNDLLAASPLVWAIALSLEALRPDRARARRLLLLLAGLLAGVSVAFKLSNGPIAMLMPMLWMFAGVGIRERLTNTALACVCTLAGCLMAYGHWGWQLWARYGNPIYPFYDAAFMPLRAMLGWAP
ncbi:MAG: hypothetical protein V4669_06425 [Pseudomonadota bacterium]